MYGMSPICVESIALIPPWYGVEAGVEDCQNSQRSFFFVSRSRSRFVVRGGCGVVEISWAKNYAGAFLFYRR